MTEHIQSDGRARGSIAAAAVSLSRLGRLRDLPVVLMLAWVGWLAIPWPSASTGESGATDQAAAVTGRTSIPAAPPRDPSEWTLSAPAAVRPVLVKPPAPDAAESAASPAPPGSGEPAAPTASPGSGEPAASERARIAGAVHDAAGHGLATIAMQAGVALLMLDERPDQVRASLEAIRATSTRALGELRAALDLIDPATAPDPDVSQLLDGVRAAGLPVELEPAGPDVPAHLQEAVYRLVRESLTNVLRHAGPATARVRVEREGDGLVVEVSDTGRGGTSAPEGRGLGGMRALATEAGGTFRAGPGDGGGFRVTARLPLSEGGSRLDPV
ncbi:sensor histidine kinase [Sphaerisporangium fuscum]|uniref:sensor histidine kinase n=1 Tax=Sphaerisporangium fuscum TaxID=2835868 RepID=UPI001BDC0458|nr:sensor histidine kinase [Sphaerisporangium fuscum]